MIINFKVLSKGGILMKAVKLLLFISVIFLVACDGFKLNSARTDSITDENEKIMYSRYMPYIMYATTLFDRANSSDR